MSAGQHHSQLGGPIRQVGLLAIPVSCSEPARAIVVDPHLSAELVEEPFPAFTVIHVPQHESLHEAHLESAKCPCHCYYWICLWTSMQLLEQPPMRIHKWYNALDGGGMNLHT